MLLQQKTFPKCSGNHQECAATALASLGSDPCPVLIPKSCQSGLGIQKGREMFCLWPFGMPSPTKSMFHVGIWGWRSMFSGWMCLQVFGVLRRRKPFPRMPLELCSPNRHWGYPEDGWHLSNCGLNTFSSGNQWSPYGLTRCWGRGIKKRESIFLRPCSGIFIAKSSQNSEFYVSIQLLPAARAPQSFIPPLVDKLIVLFACFIPFLIKTSGKGGTALLFPQNWGLLMWGWIPAAASVPCCFAATTAATSIIRQAQ